MSLHIRPAFGLAPRFLYVRFTSSSRFSRLSRSHSKPPPLRKAMRSIFLLVHPDRFSNYPKEQKLNAKSFAMLNSVLDGIEKTGQLFDTRFRLTFYILETQASSSPVAPFNCQASTSSAPSSPPRPLKKVEVVFNLMSNSLHRAEVRDEVERQLRELLEQCGLPSDFALPAQLGGGLLDGGIHTKGSRSGQGRWRRPPPNFYASGLNSKGEDAFPWEEDPQRPDYQWREAPLQGDLGAFLRRVSPDASRLSMYDHTRSVHRAARVAALQAMGLRPVKQSLTEREYEDALQRLSQAVEAMDSSNTWPGGRPRAALLRHLMQENHNNAHMELPPFGGGSRFGHLYKDRQQRQEAAMSGPTSNIAIACILTSSVTSCQVDLRGALVFSIAQADDGWLEFLRDPSTWSLSRQRTAELKQVKALERLAAEGAGLRDIFCEPRLLPSMDYRRVLENLYLNASAFQQLWQEQPDLLRLPTGVVIRVQAARPDLSHADSHETVDKPRCSVAVDPIMGYFSMWVHAVPGDLLSFLRQSWPLASQVQNHFLQDEQLYETVTRKLQRRLSLASLRSDGKVNRAQVIACCERLLALTGAEDHLHGGSAHAGHWRQRMASRLDNMRGLHVEIGAEFSFDDDADGCGRITIPWNFT
eukprot:g16056.t1